MPHLCHGAGALSVTHRVAAVRRNLHVGSESMAVQGQRLTAGTAGVTLPARIWRGLRSMTFAIFMLAVLLAVVVAGSLLPRDSGIRYVCQSWLFSSPTF